MRVRLHSLLLVVTCAAGFVSEGATATEPNVRLVESNLDIGSGKFSIGAAATSDGRVVFSRKRNRRVDPPPRCCACDFAMEKMGLLRRTCFVRRVAVYYPLLYPLRITSTRYLYTTKCP